MDKKTIYKSILAKADDGTITLTITLPTEAVKANWEEQVETAVKHTTLPGFREGKAPREMVEAQLSKEKIREEVLKKLLPEAYVQAVEEHKLRPIINPKIHVEKIEDNMDWVFSAQTCEIPDVKLKKYKEAIQKITTKSKIVIPGKEVPAPSFEEIMQAMIGEVDVTIPAILTEGEVERQLSQLLSEIKKLGLTLDQYLASTGKSAEIVRDEYAKKAEADIKLEFALQKIADEEKITVDDKEIDEAILKAKSEAEKKQLESNRYLLANILRQQKTLDYLKNL